MRLYNCNLENINENKLSYISNYKNVDNEKYKFYSKKLLKFYLFYYKEQPEKNVSFNRGTIYFLHHSFLFICFLKQRNQSTFLSGIAFLDVLDKMVFVLLSFFGCSYIFENFISAIIISLLVYLFVSWLSVDDDKRTVRRFEKLFQQVIEESKTGNTGDGSLVL